MRLSVVGTRLGECFDWEFGVEVQDFGGASVEVVGGDFGCGSFVVDFVVEERGEFADTDAEDHG
jgi:hypothetical protein